MNILIAVASRHGSTHEIAEAIAQGLQASGHAVDVRDAGEVNEMAQYDAAIVGSAVYLGNWLTKARHFVARNRARLSAIPVWLFSSGPVGPQHTQTPGDPAHLKELMQATQARGHKVFVGKLDKSALGFGERLVATMVRSPEGDFRNWVEVDAWAAGIAHELAPVGTTRPAGSA